VSHPREALGPANDAGPAAASLGRLTSRDPSRPHSLGRLTPLDPSWPTSLADLEKPPRELYFRGDLAALEGSPGRLVAIVGTREASSYGLRVARALAKAYAEAGAVVVSGLARGIDTAAHEGALEGGGKTIAVLGTGPDVAYPAANRRLLDEVADRGLVLSESPPGTPAGPGCFPRRNRIIAALSRATLVVEAGFKSGALNTAGQADALGRVIAAVPGEIDQARSMGSNLLLRDGAQVIGSVDDALGLLGLTRRQAPPTPEMGAAEAEVWHRLGEGEESAEGLAKSLDLTIREVHASVARLELFGLVTIEPDGRISRADLSRPADPERTRRTYRVRERPARRGRPANPAPLK
jgi:DNA processing protein